MTQDEFSLLFHRAQVNLVAFKMLYEPEAFEAMRHMVEMAISEEREACAVVADCMDPLQDGAIGQAIRARGET